MIVCEGLAWAYVQEGKVSSEQRGDQCTPECISSVPHVQTNTYQTLGMGLHFALTQRKNYYSDKSLYARDLIHFI